MADEVSRRDMEWRTDRPLWIRFVRLTAFLGGFAGLIVGVFFAIQFMQTPALLLDHSKPPTQAELQALSPYAQAHPGAGTLPGGQRVGLWIEIPALKIYLPIQEGDTSNSIKIPDWIAFHYPGTANPGDSGNSYLYAHGTWGRFGALLLAKDGMQVNVHNYNNGQVQTLHISDVVGKIKWNDTSWIYKQSSLPELTLQTCVGSTYYTDRWIVVAS